MSLHTKVKQNSNCAVFSRNYSEHLEEAVKISNNNYSDIITFRSATVWSSAKVAVETHRQRKIYFAPVGDYNYVQYEANLEQVQLYPELKSEKTQYLLEHCTNSTREEGLWEKNGQIGVKTLYAISNCRKLSSPFPCTLLIKLSNGCPINANFTRSYALVLEGFR
jgi:hypothetical protein